MQNLEHDVLRTIQLSVQEAINKSLTGYNNPLSKLVVEVVTEHKIELKQIITDSFESVLRTDEFKQGIREGFSHKVARTIISNNQGLFEQVTNELKQDKVFRSKLTLAVANVVEECSEK